MQPNKASNETKLPRAILRRSAAIEARYAPKLPAEPDNPNPADPTAPAATAPAEPPAPPAEPAIPPAPAGDPRHSDPAYWQQRFQVTQGILESERRERRTAVDELHQQITELQEQLRVLQAQAKPVAKADIAKFFTPEQIALYGEEQCETMAQTAMRAATDTAQTLIDAAVQPLRDQQQRDAANTTAGRKQAFTDKLTELVPDWQTIDKEPGFIAWLSEDDENEVQRQSVLNIHVGNLNALGCAKMMRVWKATQAAAPAAAPAASRVPPMAPSGSGASNDVLAAPTAAPSAAGGHPTAAEKKAFYTRSALGKVKDTERVAFEARLALPRA